MTSDVEVHEDDFDTLPSKKWENNSNNFIDAG